MKTLSSKRRRKHERRVARFAPVLAALLSSALHAQDPALAAAALAAQQTDAEPPALLVSAAALGATPSRYAGKRVAVELSGHAGERIRLVGTLRPSKSASGWMFVGERLLGPEAMLER